MSTASAAPATLQEAIQHFADPEASLDFVAGLRWPDGVTCPHCAAKEPSYLKTRRIWKCRSCRKQFSVKVGTIFEDSPIGLDKWLPALWMLANCKNGISSYELARDLGVTQKTGWFMLHRIRLAMQTNTFQKMRGKIEADETFIGGKAKFMHKSVKKRRITASGRSQGQDRRDGPRAAEREEGALDRHGVGRGGHHHAPLAAPGPRQRRQGLRAVHRCAAELHRAPRGLPARNH
jgi:transposase-like protein